MGRTGTVVALREMSPVRNAAFEETLKDFQGVLVNETARYIRKYGGDFDTVMADVQFHFLAAFESHQRRRPHLNFARWAYSVIRSRLTNTKRQSAVRNAKCPMESIDVPVGELGTRIEPAAPKKRGFDEILKNASPDAELVVRLIVEETPKELKDRLAAGERLNVSVRASLRAYLKNIGWAAERIADTFDELRRV